MNIQIFGKSKCFGSRSAERFFKERKIKYQYIDTSIKGMSIKEIESVLLKIKDVDLLFDKKSPLYEQFNVAYLKRNVEEKKQLLVDYPKLLTTPIVRDCESKKATIGDKIEEWKTWL
ncbi:MAG: ArsC/Spx/MgsR family protein [Clostridia bacterium]